ncbi:hypothetical protein N7510_010422 [Penicillium lagena]|uniref:uncharacterized protein n=1 Tax=Penicillium lagena TaxID=94218 RepID=UPI00253FC2D0|nr:uncharacterized protein N7510_010422 [Penicillium lagena]KAJ5605268.1 hypothetical protein N7510_010422 [Penicillium lagena]
MPLDSSTVVATIEQCCGSSRGDDLLSRICSNSSDDQSSYLGQEGIKAERPEVMIHYIDQK